MPLNCRSALFRNRRARVQRQSRGRPVNLGFAGNRRASAENKVYCRSQALAAPLAMVGRRRGRRRCCDPPSSPSARSATRPSATPPRAGRRARAATSGAASRSKGTRRRGAVGRTTQEQRDVLWRRRHPYKDCSTQRKRRRQQFSLSQLRLSLSLSLSLFAGSLSSFSALLRCARSRRPSTAHRRGCELLPLRVRFESDAPQKLHPLSLVEALRQRSRCPPAACHRSCRRQRADTELRLDSDDAASSSTRFHGKVTGMLPHHQVAIELHHCALNPRYQRH